MLEYLSDELFNVEQVGGGGDRDVVVTEESASWTQTVGECGKRGGTCSAMPDIGCGSNGACLGGANGDGTNAGTVNGVGGSGNDVYIF